MDKASDLLSCHVHSQYNRLVQLAMIIVEGTGLLTMLQIVLGHGLCQ